jgi:FKBP-type peptidyl-prolyl cis-trans isomerase/DNA-directed RNA polymerase subunit RPC12/RpoP
MRDRRFIGGRPVNRFKCPHCGKRLKYAEEHTGKNIRCPKCDYALFIPRIEPRKNGGALPSKRRIHAWTIIAAMLLLALAATGIWLGSRPDNPGVPNAAADQKDLENKKDKPTTPKPPEAGGAEANPNFELAKKAQSILKTNCYPCHGNDGSEEGGFNYVLELPRLLATKKIVPGNPKASRIYQRISDGEMPPEEAKQRPSADDVAVIKQWIEAGAPDFGTSSVIKGDFVRPAQMLEFMRQDLKTLDEGDRRFIRYFTLTHLANAGFAAEDLQSYRNGLSKLVNSLSWGRKVVVPQPIDPGKTILRINLNDYDWDEKTWDAIQALNPYSIAYHSDAARELAQLTLTALPYARADWFVHIAARPPLYHTILKLPTTDRELERELRIDSAEDIRKELVRRAGFNGSGVSQNNRLLERHRTGFGAYWRSYDFASNLDRKNLFQHPLGPGDAANFFQQDGGEIIFNLPNKLQAYMLIDARGNRIDKGPLAIVSDPKQKDRAVVNGISCMSCHSQGMLFKNDQVRDAVLKAEDGYSADELALIKRLYPPREEFDKLLQEDAGRFKKALEATGTKANAPEPIEGLSLRFESEVDVRLAAAETGVTTDEFLKGLAKAPPALIREFSALRSDGGSVQRDVLEKDFRELERVMELEQFQPGAGVEEGTVATASGLKFRDLSVGDGEEARTGKTVAIHYTATLVDGKKIDSSRDRNQPLEFKLGAASVKGLDQGVAGMKVGGKRKLAIPFALGYGERGAPPLIPERADLIYEVELLAVK